MDARLSVLLPCSRGLFFRPILLLRRILVWSVSLRAGHLRRRLSAADRARFVLRTDGMAMGQGLEGPHGAPGAPCGAHPGPDAQCPAALSESVSPEFSGSLRRGRRDVSGSNHTAGQGKQRTQTAAAPFSGRPETRRAQVTVTALRAAAVGNPVRMEKTLIITRRS